MFSVKSETDLKNQKMFLFEKLKRDLLLFFCLKDELIIKIVAD